MCTASYNTSNSAYPASGNHIWTAPAGLKFCALSTPVGGQCPNNYLLPIHPEWSDLEEEEKDLNKQEGEEKQEDWDGTIQNQKEEKE